MFLAGEPAVPRRVKDEHELRSRRRIGGIEPETTTDWKRVQRRTTNEKATQLWSQISTGRRRKQPQGRARIQATVNALRRKHEAGLLPGLSRLLRNKPSKNSRQLSPYSRPIWKRANAPN
jgi:hypothetical protein